MWKEKKKQNRVNEMKTSPSIHVEFILHYITYILLQCKEHIQITSNHSTINVETKNNTVKTTFNTCRIYITL